MFFLARHSQIVDNVKVWWFRVCGPFVARGDKGEEEYPYRWLGGTSEVYDLQARVRNEH